MKELPNDSKFKVILKITLVGLLLFIATPLKAAEPVETEQGLFEAAIKNCDDKGAKKYFAGADLNKNAIGEHSDSPLIASSICPDEKIAQFLIKKGARTVVKTKGDQYSLARDSDGKDFLSHFYENDKHTDKQSAKLTQLFLKKCGAECPVKDFLSVSEKYESPIYSAAQNGHLNTYNILMSYLEKRDPSGAKKEKALALQIVTGLMKGTQTAVDLFTKAITDTTDADQIAALNKSIESNKANNKKFAVFQKALLGTGTADSSNYPPPEPEGHE